MKRFALIAVALAGCTANQPGPDTLPPVAGDDGCGRSKIGDLVGKTMTAAVEADAMKRSGARTVRVIRPGMAVTMDFRPDRLNIDVNEQNVVTAVRCG